MASTEPRSSLIREGLLAWPDGPAMRVRVTLLGVPAQFAADTLAREGEAAWAWLARLPELVGELCARWGLRVTGDPMHGYMALVVPVLRGDSRYALKVSWIAGLMEGLITRGWGHASTRKYPQSCVSVRSGW